MLIGIFHSQIVESSSLVSVLFREVISHPYISIFHLLVNGFSVTSFCNDLILVHAVQLKPTIKIQISGRMASIGISDVVTASVYSEKTHMKKLIMKMIIIIMNKSQELTVFHGGQKLTSAKN